MANRVLIRNHGPDKDNVVKSFAAALKEAQRSGAKLIHLIVPAKSAFSGTVISEFLGDGVSKELLKGSSVLIKDGISLKLESPDTIRHSTQVTIALAAYLGARDLRSVDDLANVKSVVFLSWISEEGEGWQQSWDAQVLGENRDEGKLDLQPEIEEKLISLTNRINLSTGLSHPADLKAAKEMFRQLKDEALPYEPKMLRSWALRNKWRPDFAEDLYEMAEKSLQD